MFEDEHYASFGMSRPSYEVPPFRHDSELSLEQKNTLLETLHSELGDLKNATVERAKITDTENSPIYLERANAIDEAGAILEGIISPHEQLFLLESKKVMVSYSRRNEAWARKLHLALRANGMLVWFDNQQTNVSSDQKQPSDEPEVIEDAELFPSAINKGIGIGNNWADSIDNGIETDAYATVLLTHDMLDKFDVVGGREIPEMVRENNNIVVVAVDDEVRGSVLQRLATFTAEREENKQYKESIQAIQDAVTVNVSASDFEKSNREFGRTIISAMPKKPDIRVRGDLSFDAKLLHDGAFDKQKVFKSIALLKEHTPAANQEEKKLYVKALTECEVIIESQTEPENIVRDRVIEKQKFYYGRHVLSGVDATYTSLQSTLEKIGFEKSSNEQYSLYENYVLLPVTKEDLKLDPERFCEQFKDLCGTSPDLWTLVEEGFFEALSDVLIRDIAEAKRKGLLNEKGIVTEHTNTDDPLYKKVDFLRKIHDSQGIAVTGEDLKDPLGVASYIMMKQALNDTYWKTVHN